MTAIKFCGFTSSDELKVAIDLGVNAVGLVFYPPSPRAVDVQKACQLVAYVPPFVTVVALVVNMSQTDLMALAQAVSFDVVQFHGDESAQMCQQLAQSIHKRWYKAIRVTPQDTADTLLAQIAIFAQHGASAILLDTYHATQFGGTGECFDWSVIPKNSPIPIIVAGGLTADNVSAVACYEHIWAVDVSGGIERQKGIKDIQKMRDFVVACSKKLG